MHRHQSPSLSSMAHLTIEGPKPAVDAGQPRPWWSRLEEKPARYVVLAVALLLALQTGILIGSSSACSSSSPGSGCKDESSPAHADVEGHRCALGGTKPHLWPPRALVTEAALYETVLAKMAAYIQVKGEAVENAIEPGYLALDFERVVISEDLNAITFVDRCVNVSLGLHPEADGAILMSNFRWTFVSAQEPAPGDTRQRNSIKAYEYCPKVVPNYYGKLTMAERYFYLHPQTLNCLQHGPDGSVASLVVESFELEVRVPPELASRGKFSKQPYRVL